MSKMLRLELLGLVLLACTQILTEHRGYFYNQNSKQRYHSFEKGRPTREVKVKHGRLRGMVVQPKNLQQVDVFLGVPYAEPPVGSLRFTPPRSPQPWSGVRQSHEFPPVCPQIPPKLDEQIPPGRKEYLQRLLPYLENRSEDCLYLNIYAPHQVETQRNLRRYPVMVFIHGESFEWNSGNPYDGSVLASYGNVIFVTLNFRLGILGFLRPGIRDETVSNFGLLDQIAALVWLRENIAEFGGDPNSVCLVGHGTGAILANLLLMSPVVATKGLFKRAILMSGSALSSDAIGKAPHQITLQVAHALNCPTTTDDELARCLRGWDVESLLQVKIDKPTYVPAYAPLIDTTVIPNKPLNWMESAELFGRYELMYGVTEYEKIHGLTPYGLLDNERDNILREHAKATHELVPDLVLTKILEHYDEFSNSFTNEFSQKNREIVLQALSDGGTVAPLVLTGKLHSRANPKSYMYVFTHPKAMQEYNWQQQLRTVHGEELAYILGVPVDGPKNHLTDGYNIGEALFSEAMMMWWSNFAHTGNPNAPRRSTFLTDGPKVWQQYEIYWPENDPRNQTYFNLTIPPEVGTQYRSAEMKFWNEELPDSIKHPPGHRWSPTRPPFLDYIDRNTDYPTNFVKTTPNVSTTLQPPHTDQDDAVESTTPEPSGLKNSSAISMVIGFGIVFLLINLTAFFYLYHKRHNLKNKEKTLKRRLSQKDEGSKKSKVAKQPLNNVELGCKSSKPDLTDIIKNDKAYDNNSNFGRTSKLSEQSSSSTIDTHIKVRKWIQQEIVQRCSPRFLRKTRETLQKEHQEKLTKEQEQAKKKLELEALKNKKKQPIYDQNPAITVRPGKKTKAPKVSVAIDATPSARTESVMNQIPIELAKGEEVYDERLETVDLLVTDSSDIQVAPEVIVIEHHHSKSDPLPMDNCSKHQKPRFSSSKIYESDSGSASSLYAKINPKLKTRLPRIGPVQNTDEISKDRNAGSSNLYDQVAPDDIYGKTSSKLTTFGSNPQNCDINVTCREPTTEREVISPEEALRTIKRRKYPKVLPDIEKRRSLPAPNSLFIPKQFGHSLKDYKNNSQPNSPNGHNLPPLPPPRLFGTSKSLDLAEECENQNDTEPITTNLHVGPLLKRQDSTARHDSDTNLIERSKNDAALYGSRSPTDESHILGNPDGNVTSVSTKCPVHGPYLFPQNAINSISSSKESSIPDLSMGNPNWYKTKDPISKSNQMSDSLIHVPDLSIGNPNWFKPARCLDETAGNSTPPAAISVPAIPEPQIFITPRNPNMLKPVPGHGEGTLNLKALEPKSSAEPKIVITPRLGNLLGQAGQNLNQTVSNLASACQNLDQEPRIVITPRLGPNVNPGANSSSDSPAGNQVSNVPSSQWENAALASQKQDRKEPRIIITPKDVKSPSTTNLKQPKIIIKPTTNPSRNRDNKNIPKVSAIPSPECKSYQSTDKERILDTGHTSADKPPLKEKPKVTRIPSFSRRADDQASKAEKASSPVYAEKTEVIQKIEAVPTNKITNIPLTPTMDQRTGIPSLLKKDSEKSSSTDSSHSTGNSNTGTVKRKPVMKK